MKTFYLAIVFALCATAAPAQTQDIAVLAQYYGGRISNGNCVCKTRCNYGTSIFSPGRSVGACRRACANAYSGCTAGEFRSPYRRDY